MADRDLEQGIYEFLLRIQLEQFFEKIHHELHLTQLSHFNHVTDQDLTEINMSKPEQRRLFDSLKKLKKRSILTRLSFKKAKKKHGTSPGSPDSPSRNYPKREQAKSCLIKETSVTLLEKIGDGAFGFVHKGEWTTSDGSKLLVAVKSLKFSNGEAFLKEQNDFKREASAMGDLDHENVIRLYGVVLSTSMMLVMELATLGSLLDRLKNEAEKFSISKLCDFVLQVASGMSYLESKRYVHRDLATRNLLLASYDKVKIGDFGLMRPLPINEDIYVMNPLGRIPFAWCAPECLKNRQFSHASDVWAFGIMVVEMFSYGKQPWTGLNASQILEMVDEPASNRPSQPDHCPSAIYSLLLDHCWAHKPSDRSKFSSIKEKLSKLMPEEVLVLFELEADENSEKLTAQPGDMITIITWKSRLGTRFAKAQNKKTLQVGYIPVEQISRSLVKRKDSGSRPKVARIKDISPPVDNSFSHCAHRGEGSTSNWGQVMSNERQIVGKQIPLSLPSKLISLRNTDEPSKSPGSDATSSDVCSVNRIDTSSLSSHGSSNYSGRGSSSMRSFADSGYYGNNDISASPDYEPMNGSHPIAIPAMTNQAFGRQQRPKTFPYRSASNDDREPTPPRQSPAITSPQDVSCHVQRCGSTCEGFPLVIDDSDPRPPLPPKQRVIGRNGQPVMKHYPDDFEVKQEDRNAYENIVDNIYEDIGFHRPPLIPEDPQMSHSSSPASVCSIDDVLSRTLPDGNSGNERDSPPSLPPPRKASVMSKRASVAGIGAISPNSTCSAKCGRSCSLPEIDVKEHCLGREDERKANSFSFVGGRRGGRFNERDATLVDAISSETKTEASTSEGTYENIGTVAVSDGILKIPGNANPKLQPRSLPQKRQPVQRSYSDAPITRHCDNSRNTIYEQPTLDAGPWVLRNSSPHMYAEVSENLRQQLRLDGKINNDASVMNGGHARRETRGRASGCEDDSRIRDFREISSDYADLDAIWGQLRKTCSNAETKPAPQSDSPSEQSKLKSCVSACQINVHDGNGVASKRRSADQHMMSRYTFSPPQSCVDDATKESSSSSLQRGEGDALKSPRTRASLVTTV